MNSPSDQQLLRDYAGKRSDEAFAELVRRHVDLVYSAALRMVRDAHLAEDVTQGAFLVLAQSAVQLTDRPVLSGWLHRTAQNLAAKAVRADVRRRSREQEAAAMNELLCAGSEPAWEQIAQHLDAAVGELSEADRDVLMLRYFERKSAREMAQTLGISDEAAQRRVTRAVERLREFFAKRGVSVGASGLAVSISANAVQAAPVGLAVTISTAAALAETTVVTTATATVTKAIAMTALQKSLVAATLVAAIGAGIYENRRAAFMRERVLSLEQQQRPLIEQIQQLNRERDEATRQLAALRDEYQRLQASAGELPRLRGEMTRLRAAAQPAASASDASAAAAQAWVDRTQQLRARLEQTPEAKIPELQLATEDDWLNAGRRKLETEEDYRKALATLRGTVENKFIIQLQGALKKFQENSPGQFPASIAQLESFFETPIDPALLARWKVVPAREIPSLGMGGDFVITQIPVDAEFDQQWGLGPNGYGTANFPQKNQPAEIMASLYESLLASGQTFTDLRQLQPFATTLEQRAALEKVSEAFKSLSPAQQAEALRQFRGRNR